MGLRQRMLSSARVPMPDDDPTLDNPIAGTPYDPQRQAYLMGTGGAGAEAGMPTGPQHADEILSDPRTAHPEVEQQTQAQPEQQIPLEQATQAQPQLQQRMSAAGMNADPDVNEDALFQNAMNADMDDTPSNNRIQDLQGQLDARHQKPSLKNRLISLAAMAAPTLIAGFAGGSDAIEGAAGGTMDAMNTMHDRSMEQDNILRGEIEHERGRQERQYERRLQLPIAYGNMRMMRDYRKGQLQLGQDKMNTQHGDAMAKLGFDSEGQPLAEDKLPPTQKERIMLMRAHADVYDSQKALNQAKTELERAKNDPNSPLFQQLQLRYDAMLKQAEAAVSRAQSLDLNSRTREAQYYKGAFGTDATGAVLPGTFTDQAGNPMGWNAPGNPTANTKQRGQTAATVLHHFDDAPNDPNPMMQKGLLSTINRTSDQDLGLLQGHVNEWLIGQWGMDNEALSQLRTKLLLTSSAMELAHVGQSGGIEMLNHFKSMVNLGQSKGNLVANVQEMKGWLKGYADAGNANAPVGAQNPAFMPSNGSRAVANPNSGAGMAKPPMGAGKLTRPQSSAPNQLTPELAKQYLQQAGGDKAKARKLASADGYTF